MDEKMRILNMVAEGKLTAEQGAKLLEAVAEEKPAGETLAALSPEAYDRKLLHITVDSDKGDRVNVQFPVKGIKKIIRATGKLPINVDGMDGMDMSELMDGVMECLDAQVVGDFVTVSSEDGTRVRIYVE